MYVQKLILLFIVCTIFNVSNAINAFASEWLETFKFHDGTMIYTNTDEIDFSQHPIIKLWVKFKYPEGKRYLNKRLLQRMTYFAINCQNRKFAVYSGISYDENFDIIDSYNFEEYNISWNHNIPDTISSHLYEALCVWPEEE